MFSRKYFNGVQVEITRTFVVGNTWYHDIVEVASRKKHRVKIHELEDDTEVAHNMNDGNYDKWNIVFVRCKDNEKFTFEDCSGGYLEFVSKNKLDKVAIENCLNGIQKTHKGYKIYKEVGY